MAKYSFSTSRCSNCDGQLHVHLVGLGDDHHAAGVAIEPMHDAGARGAAGGAELVEMELQGRGQRAGPVPLGRDARPCLAGLLITAICGSS